MLSLLVVTIENSRISVIFIFFFINFAVLESERIGLLVNVITSADGSFGTIVNEMISGLVLT